MMYVEPGKVYRRRHCPQCNTVYDTVEKIEEEDPGNKPHRFDNMDRKVRSVRKRNKNVAP